MRICMYYMQDACSEGGHPHGPSHRVCDDREQAMKGSCLWAVVLLHCVDTNLGYGPWGGPASHDRAAVGLLCVLAIGGVSDP